MDRFGSYAKRRISREDQTAALRRLYLGREEEIPARFKLADREDELDKEDEFDGGDEIDEDEGYKDPTGKPTRSNRKKKRPRKSTPPVSNVVQEDQDASYLKWQSDASPEKADYDINRLKFFLAGETEAEWLDENEQKWSMEVLRKAMSLAYMEICEVLHVSIKKRMAEAQEVNLEVVESGWEVRDESFTLDADEFRDGFAGFDPEELLISLNEARAEIAWLRDNRDSFVQTLEDARNRSSYDMTFYFTGRNAKLESLSNIQRSQLERAGKQRLLREAKEDGARLGKKPKRAKQSEEEKPDKEEPGGEDSC